MILVQFGTLLLLLGLFPLVGYLIFRVRHVEEWLADVVSQEIRRQDDRIRQQVKREPAPEPDRSLTASDLIAGRSIDHLVVKGGR